jgi:CHAT domain-containing protein
MRSSPRTAASVIGTLWRVGDSQTMSALMAGFYKYLACGMHKSAALRQAILHRSILCTA